MRSHWIALLTLGFRHQAEAHRVLEEEKKAQSGPSQELVVLKVPSETNTCQEFVFETDDRGVATRRDWSDYTQTGRCSVSMRSPGEAAAEQTLRCEASPLGIRH